MKKQLLSIFGALAASSFVAQTVSPSWNNIQNAAFTNTSVGIKFMDAVDPNVMWVTGYDGSAPNRNYNWFSRTINGGTSFNSGVIFTSTLTPSIGDTSTFVLSNLSAIDANTAWVAAFRRGPAPYSPSNQGGGAIYRTTNGGLNWTNMTPPGMFTNTASSFANFVAFLTPSIGIANGDPVNGEYELWRTVDGGLSWSPIPAASIPNPSGANEFAIVDLYAKQGNTNLWFGTNQGRMYRTNDAGLTWNVSVVAPATTTIVEIAFATPLNGVVYAFDASQNFVMYNTTDGGANWNQITPVSPNVGRNDIVEIPGTGYYASAGAGNGNTIISYSSDNGVTWNDWGGSGIQYLTLDFVNSTTGWAGSFSNNTDPTLEGIFKYTGSPISGTVTPTSVFTLPSYICGPNGTVTAANASTGSGVLSYSWTVSPSAVFSSPTASAPSISFAGNGSYTITLTVTSNLGSNASSQIIDVLACTPPVPTFTMVSSVCNNVPVIAANTSNIFPAASYSWSSSPSAGVTYPSSPTAFNPTIKFATPGTYTVTVLASNISGTATATQTITVNDCTPVANFTLAEVAEGCAGSYTTETGTMMGVATATPSWINPSSGHTLSWSIVPTTSVQSLNFGQFARLLNFSIPNTYTVTLIVSNVSGTSTPVSKVITVNNCAAVGISENNNNLIDLNIYPNPAHDLLNVTLPASSNEVYKIKLINVIGAVVYEEKTTKENVTISLVGKAKGVYFLTVEGNHQKATKKVVID